MVCPECGGWGFDTDGRDCEICDGIGELPFEHDVTPGSVEPVVEKPQPPEYDPSDPQSDNDLTNADWWKQGEEESGPYFETPDDGGPSD